MDQIKIGSFLKELRKEKGITQEHLAETVGVSNRSVSRWENGSNMPNLDILCLLAEYYQVEISDLLGGERRTDNRMLSLDDTILQVADYNSCQEKAANSRMLNVLRPGMIAFTIFIIMELTGFGSTVFKSAIMGVLLGASYGAMGWSAFYTHHNLAKLALMKEKINRSIFQQLPPKN